MASRLILPPTALAVDFDVAKEHVKADGNALDASVTAWVEGITAHAEHYTGRSFISQMWLMTLDKFPDLIKLCNPRLIEVETLRYYDADDVLQRLTSADYIVENDGDQSYIRPARNKQWPDTDPDRISAVSVEIMCGYGSNHAAVPKAIKLYIYAKLVEQFKPGKPVEVQTSFIDSLLDRYKIWSLG